MFLLNDPDRSTVAQQDFFEPDLSVNPLSAAVRGFGAGMSLAPTVAQFMLGDDEPIVEELPSLLTMASRGAKGEIRSLVDTAAENATMYRARQEDAMMQSGMASNLSYGISYYLSGFVGGGLNPASYGLGLGKARMETEIRAGVDEDTAFTIGAIEGVTAGVGAGIPFLGKTMVQRFGFGVAANVVPGIAQRKAEQVTFGEVYQKRAPDVFDPVALTVDAVMGGAFGYLSGLGAKPDTIPMDAVNDALDANLNVRAADAAPGFPNPKAFGIHMRMVKETLDAQAEGRAPDYSPLLDAEFADSPEMLRNFEESLADVTAGRMTDDRPIYDDILPQIEATGVYSAPEARANAKLASMAYTAMAKRMGMNPRDLMDQVPLRVVTDAVEGFGQPKATSARFSEDNRLSNLSETGASMARIREQNKALQGKKPDDEITIYRATIGDTIRPDDFVAVSRDVAEMELENVSDRDGASAKIIEQKVKVRDLLMGNDATEFVYFPEPLRQSALPVLDSVNPTGSVFVDYTPQARANAPLADNMVTLDKTIGGSADDPITIYRGTIGDAIVAGDFVTTNKQLAKDYAGTGKVVEMQVKKGDVIDDINEPGGEEYIYRPQSKDSVLPATIEINGTQRSTLNSEGQPLAQTEEGVRNFWNWFGDSKVVDADGKPLVVYHGTDKSFTKIDLKKGAQGLFWFTSNKADIEAGEVGASGKGKIMELYAKLESPANWKQYDQLMLDEFKSRGLDGAILPESDGNFVGFIINSPTQIKSAAGNRGTFDPADASILNQETRGTYAPDTNTIGLTRAADSSTFVHELGHHLFEMLGKLASDPNAPTQIRADFKTLVEHGGMKVDDWYASDINTRRAAHEKIADDFENYLMTGDAPSLELRNLFGMIRDWMLGVYKTIRGDVQPEVRAVFDRMLATDEQMAMKSQVVDYLAIQRQTEAKAKSSLDDNLMAAERAIDPNVEVVIDGTRIKASELLKAEEPQEATAMQKLKECLLNV